ncbi:MAG: purine-nucleoside phosphorylase [Flavobacteriales bacterium]
MDTSEMLKEMMRYLSDRGIGEVDVAVICGTGLGGFTQEMDEQWVALSYNQIPFFPVATVEFHFGRLVYGRVGDVRVLAFEGRFHYYEGHSMEQVVLPVRLAKSLGAQAMLLSNAAGGLNPNLKKGALMRVEDHINLQPESPLRGPNEEKWGGRFPDMSQPYHSGIGTLLHQLAADQGVRLVDGVYVSVAGPQLETRAEYRYLRTIGGDAVGMSTVPEVIACAHMGLPCAVISVITDECDPDHLAPVDVAEIVSIAQQAEPQLTALFKSAVLKILEVI